MSELTFLSVSLIFMMSVSSIIWFIRGRRYFNDERHSLIISHYLIAGQILSLALSARILGGGLQLSKLWLTAILAVFLLIVEMRFSTFQTTAPRWSYE